MLRPPLVFTRNINKGLQRHFSAQSNKCWPSLAPGDEPVQVARNWLQNVTAFDIPRHHFHVSFSRASGPGGQKVNKTSSKATIALTPSDWLGGTCRRWMPCAVLEQLRESPFRYQTKAGGILIQSDSSRNQHDNVDDCFRKLLAEIRQCVHFPDNVQDIHKAKWRRLAAKAKDQRLQEKKRHSDKKRSRSRAFDL